MVYDLSRCLGGVQKRGMDGLENSMELLLKEGSVLVCWSRDSWVCWSSDFWVDAGSLDFWGNRGVSVDNGRAAAPISRTTSTRTTTFSRRELDPADVERTNMLSRRPAPSCASRQPRVRLIVEELESRITPSTASLPAPALGPEFRIDPAGDNAAANPAVACNSSGVTMVVWSSGTQFTTVST